MGTGDVTPAPTEPRELEGSTLGPYRIERLLGEGAMGEVFLATHIALGRPVALKTLKPAVAVDRALTERFFAEARAVNIIRHENIVECTDLVNDPSGRSYIVMELLEGKTLGAAISEVGRIPVRRTARIAAQIADAIGAAHGKGIVHRDLKPENVYLIRRAGSADYVKVLDFGIARLRPEMGVSATQSGALIGTPAYMSPEQVRGEKVGPAADIYALGTIAFHMLTGRMPFDASSLSMMLVAQLQETPVRVDKLVPDVPRAMADLVARALSKEAALRPADMAAFRREVMEAAGLPSDAHASLVDSSPSLPYVRAATDPSLLPTIQSAGQSSITASAGQVIPKPASKTWLLGGAALVLVAAIVMIAVAPWRSDTTLPPTKAATNATTDTPESPSPEPAKAEPVKVEPVKVEPVKPEPVKVEPVKKAEKAEPAKPEPARPEPARVAAPKAVPKLPKAESPKPPKPEAPKSVPAPECLLPTFMRVYQACSDKAAADAALTRLVRCRKESKLPAEFPYDVVKNALLNCL